MDDNEWDKLGIQRVLDWSNLEIEIIGSCANGKLAMECVEKEKPDNEI